MEFLAPLFNQKNTHNNFFLLAGPCVVENEEVLFKTASTLKNICEALSIPLIFKSSFTKANRSSANSFTSIGHEKALNMLANVKAQYDLPLV
ncbi:MAG TPA: 3-deoxy-8-phosphooctulonate synthase, partial [Chitinophagaceae bacterium]|nr:3-deoxy-8-phosphooctulonate synthase [Chitinophagaceae bacterium]